MKFIFLLLSCCCISFFETSPDFKKELTQNEFKALNTRHVPLHVLHVLGYNSYLNVGTKSTQKGCTSGKEIVIDWASTDKQGMYVLSVSSCGAYSNAKYYVIRKGNKYELPIAGVFRTFESFKTAYLGETK